MAVSEVTGDAWMVVGNEWPELLGVVTGGGCASASVEARVLPLKICSVMSFWNSC